MASKTMWLIAASIFLNISVGLAQTAELAKMEIVDPPGLALTDTATPVPFKYSGIKYDLKATGKTLNEGSYKDCYLDVYAWEEGYSISYYPYWVNGYYRFYKTDYYPSSSECEGTSLSARGYFKYVPRGVKTYYRKSSPEMKSSSTPVTLSQFSKSMEACAKDQGNAINAALSNEATLKQFSEKHNFKSVSIQILLDSTKGDSGISMKAKIDGSKSPELVVVAIAKDEKGCREKISQTAFTELLQKWTDRK